MEAQRNTTSSVHVRTPLSLMGRVLRVEGCWTSCKQGSLSHVRDRAGASTGNNTVAWSCCVHMAATRETGIQEATVSKLCCWRGSTIHVNINTYIKYIYIHTYTHIYTHIHVWPPPVEAGKGTGYGCLCCAPVCVCLPDWCGQTCLHVNVMCACALWACSYQQYILHLITGHIWGMELQQPQGVGSSIVFFL